MNKEQFLAALRRLLRELLPDERERILAYYREMIEDKVESGQTEEEAVQSLGNIYALAQKILTENPNRRPRNTGKIALITVLSVIGVCIVASIVVGLIGWNAFQFHKASVSPVSDGYEYKTHEERAHGINTISISAENKDVVLTPVDGNRISVDYETNSTQFYNVYVENGTFYVKNTENGRNWLQGWNWSNNDERTITVAIPKDYTGAIQINTTNSYINASDFENLGELRCQTTNSAINIKNLFARDLELQTENAAIELQNLTVSEKITAGTQNAQINLDRIKAPDISLQTQNALISGTIRGEEDDYTISAQTTNAISNLKDRAGGKNKLTVETTNAIIDVRFEK